MRINREIIGIGVLLLLFIGAALVMSGRDNSKSRVVGTESTPDPSIYNDRASGSRALYEYVRDLGFRTGVWRREWSNLGQSRADVLIAVAPDSETQSVLTGMSPFGGGDDSGNSTMLTSKDAGYLESWLRKGKTAIVLTSNLLTDKDLGGGGDDTTADTLGVSVSPLDKWQGIYNFGAYQPTPLANDVISLRMSGDSRIRSALPGLVPLFGDRLGPVVAALSVGSGRLILVADGEFASNGNLGYSDNAVFLANVLTEFARPGARILFDEYHHGDTELEGGATVWSALGRPLQLAIVQIVLAILVAFAVVAVRFGTPVPLIRAGERNSAEYVTSLSNLYWKAGASTTALEMIYRQFLRETTSRLGLSADVNLEQLADAAGRRGGVSVMEMRRLLAHCEQYIDSGRISEAELLDLVRRMDRIRKDIGIA